MYVVGPLSVRLALRAFVVVVGFLILAGAVNTAIVGSNGVLNRVAEDGVLPDWFRHPHRRYGTTHRLDQSGRRAADLHHRRQPRRRVCPRRGLRLRRRVELRVQGAVDGGAALQGPPAARVAGAAQPARSAAWKLPLGLILIFLVLLATALVNLLTKKVATEWGVAFTRRVLRHLHSVGALLRHKRGGAPASREVQHPIHAGARSGRACNRGQRPCKIVPVRDPGNLTPPRPASLQEAEDADVDVVVPTVKVERGLAAATATNRTSRRRSRRIFTRGGQPAPSITARRSFRWW